MCRIAAYFGPPVRLSSLLTEPSHSLLRQSYAPREMTDGTLNADGWGVGWFDPQLGPGPGVLKGTQPIWSDENAHAAGRAIASGSILAIVRGATPGLGTSQMNTPPFVWHDELLAHNGRFWPWPGALARELRHRLDSDVETALRGTTDTELLGALYRSELRKLSRGDSVAALQAALRIISELAHDRGGGVSANVILARSTGLLATRFARPNSPPSLYLCRNARDHAGGTLIASEPLNEVGEWEEVPPMSLVRIDAAGARVEPLF